MDYFFWLSGVCAWCLIVLAVVALILIRWLVPWLKAWFFLRYIGKDTPGAYRKKRWWD